MFALVVCCLCCLSSLLVLVASHCCHCYAWSSLFVIVLLSLFVIFVCSCANDWTRRCFQSFQLLLGSRGEVSSHAKCIPGVFGGKAGNIAGAPEEYLELLETLMFPVNSNAASREPRVSTVTNNSKHSDTFVTVLRVIRHCAHCYLSHCAR